MLCLLAEHSIRIAMLPRHTTLDRVVFYNRHLRDPTAMYGHEKAVYPKLDRRRADMPFKAHARNDSYREVLFYELTRKSKAQKLMNY